MLKNRSRTEIIYDLVKATKGGAKKTHLMYKANLNYTVLEQYLNFLQESGLIREENGAERLYFATGKGLKFLTMYEELASLAAIPKISAPISS
jgi:predicted transcriptional regulator